MAKCQSGDIEEAIGETTGAFPRESGFRRAGSRDVGEMAGSGGGGDMGGGQSTATSFGVESSGGVVTILANRLKQNGVVPQSVVLGR